MKINFQILKEFASGVCEMKIKVFFYLWIFTTTIFFKINKRKKHKNLKI